MKDSLRTFVVGGLKAGLSGALICAIAWCFVTYDSMQGEVGTAEAHIFSLDAFAPMSEEQRFMTVLRDRGMEKPRSYNWNGNTVYFSMESTQDSPNQVLHQIQQSLVDKGINKKKHTELLPAISQASAASPQTGGNEARAKSARAHIERVDDFFSGGLVPTRIEHNHVMMAGAIPKGDAVGALGFLKKMVKERKSPPEAVGAMRFVEAWRDPGDSSTTVAAIWSDDKLELDKFKPNSTRSDLGVNPDIPVCMGCQRLMRFAGEGNESDYATTIFVGPQTVPEVVEFYDRALRRRGWKLSEASTTTRLLKQGGLMPPSSAQTSTYGSGSQFLTVMAYPIDRGMRTQVHVVESP